MFCFDFEIRNTSASILQFRRYETTVIVRVMANIDLSEPSFRGQKRSRLENQNLEAAATPEISRKRRRIDNQPVTFVGFIKKAVTSVWSYFWGSSNQEVLYDMEDADNDEVRWSAFLPSEVIS